MLSNRHYHLFSRVGDLQKHPAAKAALQEHDRIWDLHNPSNEDLSDEYVTSARNYVQAALQYDRPRMEQEARDRHYQRPDRQRTGAQYGTTSELVENAPPDGYLGDWTKFPTNTRLPLVKNWRGDGYGDTRKAVKRFDYKRDQYQSDGPEGGRVGRGSGLIEGEPAPDGAMGDPKTFPNVEHMHRNRPVR